MRLVRRLDMPTNHYAGFVTRAIALGIDAVIITIVVSILTAVVGLIISLFTKVDTSSGAAILGTLGSWAVMVAAYFTFSWAAAGQTLGQHVMQIRVLRLDGKHIGLIRSYARFLALSICMGPLILGQLLVLFTPRRRALHDLMVRTVVVYTDPVGRELPVVDATVGDVPAEPAASATSESQLPAGDPRA